MAFSRLNFLAARYRVNRSHNPQQLTETWELVEGHGGYIITMQPLHTTATHIQNRFATDLKTELSHDIGDTQLPSNVIVRSHSRISDDEETGNSYLYRCTVHFVVI